LASFPRQKNPVSTATEGKELSHEYNLFYMGVFVIVYKHNSRTGNYFGAVRGIQYLTASGNSSMKFEPSLVRWNVRSTIN